MARLLRLVLLAALWLILFCMPAHAAQRALLVGCDHFVSQQDTFPASANNVAQMADALAGSREEWAAMTTLPDGLSGVDALESAVAEAFAGAEAEDISYFYISTHGLWNRAEPAEGMTLLLSDGVGEQGVTASGLKAMFDRVPGKKVLILDACHAGAVIGKGVDEGFVNIFAGEEYKVLCSSGGAEESWFWAGTARDGRHSLAGAGYFSGALTAGISAAGDFAADSNRDGTVTLSELKRYLLQMHGASTVQSYPEEDEFPLLRYEAENTSSRTALLDVLTFEPGALSSAETGISFSFTVLRPVQVAYQLVYQRDGRWDFDHATLQFDNAEQFQVYGDQPGWLMPGRKERTIDLSPESRDSGYVLLQVLAIRDGRVTVAGATVVCVPPAAGNPELRIDGADSFSPAAGAELTMAVRHSVPCELTVTIETVEGDIVRRLCSGQPTRPENLSPAGTTVVWNGRLSDGTMAPAGKYMVRVSTRIGGVRYQEMKRVLVEE